MKYIIDEIPPSYNRFGGRKNVWEYREEKKRWEQLVKLCCRPVPEKPLSKAVVRITYYFKTRGRRDPDNYSGKFILDGLGEWGLIRQGSVIPQPQRTSQSRRRIHSWSSNAQSLKYV